MSKQDLTKRLLNKYSGSIDQKTTGYVTLAEDGSQIPFVSPPENPTVPYNWNIEEHGITQGTMGSFMTCPQKAAFYMKEGLKTKGHSLSTALDFGDVFHRALDVMYTNFQNSDGNDRVSDEEEIDIVMEDIRTEDREKMRSELRPPSQFSEYEVLHGTARVLMYEYWARWKTDLISFDWVDLERTFEVRKELEARMRGEVSNKTEYLYTPSIPIRGKFDGVFRSKDGHLWLFETKTKARIEEQVIVDKLNYDLQVMTYLWAIKHTYGETPRGVVYNVVKRPQLRQKVNESLPDFLDRIQDDIKAKKSEYFIRFNGAILPEELEAWENGDFKNITEQIYNWATGEFNFRNSTACQLYNRPCEYMRACAYGDKSNLAPREIRFPELEFEGNKI